MRGTYGLIGVVFLIPVGGCSTLTETLGIGSSGSQLLEQTKAIRDTAPVPAPIPRELAKGLLPAHIVEPGDTLLIQPVELDSPIRLPPDQPVQPDGTIDLGKYGRPVVAGKTLAEVEAQVKAILKSAEKPDKDEKDVAKDAAKAEKDAARDAAIAVTVRLIGRPGRVFYVMGEVNAPGAFPATGRETVLDAIIAAGGITKRASEGNVILARPTLPDGCRLVYPVCYQRVVQLGDTTTNYQLQPGDRVFVPGKSTRENLLPKRCQTPTPACMRPEFSCFGGACAPAAP